MLVSYLQGQTGGHEGEFLRIPPGLSGQRRALVLTLDQTDSLIEDGLAIEVMPAWKWLTGGKA